MRPGSGTKWTKSRERISVDPGARDATGRQIARDHQAPFVAAITGPANLLVSVTCRDASHLYR